MILKLIVLINFAKAALQQRDTCNDQEIHDRCLAECRLDYLECRANCDSQLCDSGCLAEFQECESTCPCGLDCPAGCRDCMEHPLCQDACEDAQLNNFDYQVCLNNAVNELEICLKMCPVDIECHNSCYASYTEQLLLCPCFDKETTTTTAEISTTTTAPIEPSVSILVIPEYIGDSYLQSGDGSSQISATINAPEIFYAEDAAHALVNGELHIFGGSRDGYKIARLDGCSFYELPARLKEERTRAHSALSIENCQEALVCFGNSGDTRKSCEIFDGSSTTLTFAPKWTHKFGGLGLFQNQPATVGCYDAQLHKAETLSTTGWNPLPDFPLKITRHSLVGLENGAMLLLGGFDVAARRIRSDQTGIWELKEERWSRIGELSKPAYGGSAIYVGRSVYYFEPFYLAVYRVDLDENEELEAVEKIDIQPNYYYGPVLFQTDNDYCT